MKKIVITTFINADNYGAQLQAYALSNVLNKKNDVSFLNYKDDNIERVYHFMLSRNTSIKDIIKAILFYKKNKLRSLNFSKFRQENLKLTDRYISIEQLKDFNCDVLITGSDQVWNKGITGEISDVYTLNFGKANIKRISYAASIGVSSLDNKTEEILIDKIKKIDYISLREKTACNLISKSITDREIKEAIDPTLLLDMEDWNKIIEKTDKQLPKEKYIFAYAVGNYKETIEIANRLSERTGLKIIYFDRMNKGYKNVLKNEFTSGPEDFLFYLKNAEYVVASSFHGTVFSILFEKEFWVIPHKSTGARVVDLLDNLGLSNRIINNINEFENKNYNEEIDFNYAKQKIKELREDSLQWLIKAIEK